MTTVQVVQQEYLGSVGIYSPLFNDLLPRWTGLSLETGNTVPLRNFSATMEYKIFQISNHCSLEEQEAVFVPQEQAKMLLGRSDIPEDAPDIEEQKKIINDAVEASKVVGRIISIKYDNETSWMVPGQP